MGIFLNSSVPYEEYKNTTKMRFFVDKTPMIDELISAVTVDGQRYFCVTRPRRFGKSVIANMIGAFFGKTFDGKGVFKELKIARMADYQKYLNQYDIIYIDFSRRPRDCKSYGQYIDRIQDGINYDLAEAYPELRLDSHRAVWDNLQVVLKNCNANIYL